MSTRLGKIVGLWYKDHIPILYLVGIKNLSYFFYIELKVSVIFLYIFYFIFI